MRSPRGGTSTAQHIVKLRVQSLREGCHGFACHFRFNFGFFRRINLLWLCLTTWFVIMGNYLSTCNTETHSRAPVLRVVNVSYARPCYRSAWHLRQRHSSALCDFNRMRKGKRLKYERLRPINRDYETQHCRWLRREFHRRSGCLAVSLCITKRSAISLNFSYQEQSERTNGERSEWKIYQSTAAVLFTCFHFHCHQRCTLLCCCALLVSASWAAGKKFPAEAPLFLHSPRQIVIKMFWKFTSPAVEWVALGPTHVTRGSVA